jgi:UDP-N-acetylmuramate dehydrogenase
VADFLKTDARIAEVLSQRSDIELRQGLLGRDVSTFAIGGPLRALVDVGSLEALQFLVSLLGDIGIEPRVVGNGSNLLISDQGISDWLIRFTGALRTSEPGETDQSGLTRWTCGAGCSLMALSREVANLGLSGLAFAGGIPASIGGAVKMNAGAHGGEMSQVVEWVKVLNAAGQIEQRSVQQLQFSYRHSALTAAEFVLEVGLLLRRTSTAEACAERAHCLEERRARQPLTMPSAGSIFKNPSPEQSAGWLIEQAGLKGHRIGDIEISDKHANWIVNPRKQGLAADVMRMITHCQEVVERQSGVLLVPEVIYFSSSANPSS